MCRHRQTLRLPVLVHLARIPVSSHRFGYRTCPPLLPHNNNNNNNRSSNSNVSIVLHHRLQVLQQDFSCQEHHWLIRQPEIHYNRILVSHLRYTCAASQITINCTTYYRIKFCSSSWSRNINNYWQMHTRCTNSSSNSSSSKLLWLPVQISHDHHRRPPYH